MQKGFIMKKLLILACMPLYGSHLTLDEVTKASFVEKRLTMMQTQLAHKLHELLQEDTLPTYAEVLNQEVDALKKRIQITQNSLLALKGA